MTKICLIDGSGYIFRAFYALPPMTAPDGTPVNAVYGIMTMFMRLLNKIKCDYCVVVFDAKRENFRNEIFNQYKATRGETPELLIPQFDIIHHAVEALNLPWTMQEGYEADDLIATYTEQALQKNWKVVVVSGDKDLMQLIKNDVEFYDGMKDKFFTDKDVVEKFGVTPDKVVDVQALSGDKIDNIPGVPGIGPKTAAELVNQFGSLQQVLANAEQIPQARKRELIMQNKEAAEISLKLVTLKKDVPVKVDIEEFAVQAPDMKVALQFADKYGFKSVRPKLEKWVEERSAELGGIELTAIQKKTEKKYSKIENKKQLAEILQKIKNNGKLAFQVLHDNSKTVGFSLCCAENEAYYLPVLTDTQTEDLFSPAPKTELDTAAVKQFLLNVLSDKNIVKIALDLKPQWHWLKNFSGCDIDLFPYHDTAVMSYVLDSSEHGHSLSDLAEICLGETLSLPTADSKSKIINFESESAGNFVFAAADFVLQIYNVLSRRIFSEHKNYMYETVERRLVQVLYEMENNGITVDEQALRRLDEALSKDLAAAEKQIYALAGEEFNIASPKQIGEILFGKMGLKGKKNASGSYNTSAEVLEKLADENELAAKILEWRGYAKLKSTYTTALLEAKDADNRVHTTFSQTVVNTGRLASSNPNLQNIPNHGEMGHKIRECFVAQKGYKIVDADYSQMELRLLAAVAGVRALQEAFANGVDIHAATAARVFGLPYEQVDKEHRSRAKAINFGIVYGISQYGLAKQLGIGSAEAKQYIDTYFAVMPEIKEFMNKTIAFAHANGFVTTPFGRKCSVFGINDQNKSVVAMAERAAINAPIQGGAADLVKLAMQRVYFALKDKFPSARLLLQVHDELVVEAKEEEAQAVGELMKNIMENVADLAVKMLAEPALGDNWAQAH